MEPKRHKAAGNEELKAAVEKVLNEVTPVHTQKYRTKNKSKILSKKVKKLGTDYKITTSLTFKTFSRQLN